MHVESSRRPHVRKDGTEVVYERHLLRRSFRNAQGKPGKETLANLSALPGDAIAAIRAVLAGKTLVDVAEAFEITRSLPHGHVAEDAIEAELARRHLCQGGMAMFDLSSSWMEGTCCELAGGRLPTSWIPPQ